MKRRVIILYWLLLLVPTVVISVATVRLLRHEQERMTLQRERVLTARAEVTADHIRLAIRDVEEELLAELRRLDAPDPVPNLVDWQRRHPLIRNVYVWSPKAGLIYPATDATATREERSLAARYAPLFDGRVAWRVASGYGSAETAGEAESRTSTMPGGRSSFRSWAAYGDSAASAPEAGGWIPWFDGNRLGLLSWVERSNDGLVYGLEIEFAALLAQVMGLFPDNPGDMTLALFDDAGRLAHQVGAARTMDAGAEPAAVISLAPEWPHWEIRAYEAGAATGASPRAFLTLGLLVLGVFVVSILAGGALLTGQAVRNARDAVRKTTFVSNVSHELKTPLTSIRMYAELLSENRVSDETKRSHYLQVIVAEAQRLARLVNNMLDFSRLEQGRKRYRVEPLDAAVFLREFADAHRLRLQQAGMDMTIDIPDGPIRIMADRDALEQTLLNLVDNAVKYAGKGGTLDVTLEDAGAEVRIHVKDRGPGVPEAHRERIFEKFHRVDDTLTSEQPGSGLGLTLARSLMRGVGGDVVYRPREGGGSDFVVSLGGGAG